MESEDVVAALKAYRYRYGCEDDLQESVAAVLTEAGFEPVREVVVGDGRVDLVCGRVGIECKVAGSVAMVIRQLDRYAKSGEFDALVLVSPKASHRRVPAELGGVPVAVVTVTVGL